jgi:outer membrane receptor protein involved in Fe transport
MLFTMPSQILIGTNYRSDSVGVIQEPTVDRNPSGPKTEDLSYTEHGWGQFVQAQFKPLPWLKLTGGGRYDHFWYDVDDRLGLTLSPQYDTGTLSPKAGVAVTPFSWLEIFANYGQGFRSPSVVFELQSAPNPKPQKLRSQEVGFQIQTARFRFLADVWSTTLDREVFQPAPGLPFQEIGRSRREGYDIETRYFVKQDASGKASLFVNYTQMRAVLRDRGPSQFVPNVPAYIVNIGTDLDLPIGGAESPHRLSILFYGQYYGKRHLSEDGVQTTHPYPRVSGRVAYYHQRIGWTAYADLIWYPGDRLSETAVNFGPAVGATASDIFVNPQAPTTVMVGAAYHFKTGA